MYVMQGAGVGQEDLKMYAMRDLRTSGLGQVLGEPQCWAWNESGNCDQMGFGLPESALPVKTAGVYTAVAPAALLAMQSTPTLPPPMPLSSVPEADLAAVSVSPVAPAVSVSPVAPAASASVSPSVEGGAGASFPSSSSSAVSPLLLLAAAVVGLIWIASSI